MEQCKRFEKIPDSESIFSQLSEPVSKEKQKSLQQKKSQRKSLKSDVETCVDWMSFDFDSKIFLICSLK